MFNKIVYQFSSTSIKKGFDNSADEETIKHIKEIDSFLDKANESWQRYSALNGIPSVKFRLLSGYRCPELNSFLNASDDSAHLKGYAADITIKETRYWKDFYIWASEFAKECSSKHILFDQIILEGSGQTQWIHFSIRDYNGNQTMKSLVINQDNPNQVKSVVYGSEVKISKTDIDESENYFETEPITLIEEESSNPTPSNQEIEGEHGKNQMDLEVMPGTYMRCIYVMKRLMKSFSFTPEQSASIVGNLLMQTEGRLNTTKIGVACGICQWGQEKQTDFRRMFLNENRIETSNLMNQVSFLIKEIVKYNLHTKLSQLKNINDACIYFYKNYIRRGEYIDLTELFEKQNFSSCRAYSNAALEIYKNYIDDYKDEWLVGYYVGEGVNDGPSIQKTNDTKLWKSSFAFGEIEDSFMWSVLTSDEMLELLEESDRMKKLNEEIELE